MAKTRIQTGNTAIKKEGKDSQAELLLNGVNNTRRSSRIAKRAPVTNNRRLPAQQVKVEEDFDTKALLKSPSQYSECRPRPIISQEQINQPIHYIVNDNMPVYKASRKANISRYSGTYYYNIYRNDPEKKIPLPQNRFLHPRKYHTQKQIGNLIKCVDDDKMTMKESSAKADMPYSSAHHYYNRYLKDPNHTIPIRQLRQYYTQDQKEAFIGYIINDKMSIKAASKKAKMNLHGAKSYYRRHFKQQNPDIARPRHIVTLKRYTQKQIKGLISYIVDDKMPIRAASRKANFSRETARKYYQRYLNDNNMEIPVSKMGKHCTQDQINELVVYIVDDKMTVKAASKKANMAENSGQKYYHQYLKDRNVDGSLKNCCTQEQINELIDYIVDDRMSIRAASKKANLTYATSHRYYRQYANDQKLDTPTRSPRVDSARKNK